MKNIKKYLFISFAICLFANYSYSQNYFVDASKAFLSADYDKAIALYNKSIENKQELAKSYLLRGASKFFLNLLDEALADLDQSKLLDSSNFLLPYYYGKLHLHKKEARLAIEYYNRYISNGPKDALALTERGEAKFQMKDFKGCIADENAAIEIDSTAEAPFAIRGFAKVKLKKYNDAITDLNTSLRLKPNKNAYTWRGMAWWFTRQYERSIDDYTKALAFDPQNADLYLYRGLSYNSAGKKAEACTDLKKSHELGCANASGFLQNTKCE
jgi:tetratricopeptide (TPR) repeat protein